MGGEGAARTKRRRTAAGWRRGCVAGGRVGRGAGFSNGASADGNASPEGKRRSRHLVLRPRLDKVADGKIRVG